MIDFKRGVLALALTISALGVADAYTIDVSYNGYVGDYLIEENGLTLYRHQGDEHILSNLNSYDWPPFYTAVFNIPSILNINDFGTITRRDGLSQTTYKGWPLYLYRNRSPGDISGDGVNDMHVVNPEVDPL